MTKVDNLLQKIVLDNSTNKEDGWLSDPESRRSVFGLEDLVDQNQASATADMKNLLEICLGIKAFIEDPSHRAGYIIAEDRPFLSATNVQRSREKMPTSVFSRILRYIKDVKLLLARLTYVFGSFSVEALKYLQRLLHINLEIRGLLGQILTEMPIARLSSESSDPCIHFRDALGRVHDLEYKWFQHYEIFASMLRCLFENKPGQHHVRQGMFRILDMRGKGRLVNQNNWKEIVVPASRLRMVMVTYSDSAEKSQCPRCLAKPGAKSPAASSLVRCSQCSLEYSYSPINAPLAWSKPKKGSNPKFLGLDHANGALIGEVH